MKFCTQCGNAVEERIPDGDDRHRYVCSSCGTVHYSNPNIVVGCVVEHESRILLCKRAINPRSGFWTLPAGFLEHAETTAEGAARETWEEALARVDIHDLFSLISVPHIGQVHMFYRASLQTPEFRPGPESLEVALFAEEDIPWDDIAFPTVGHTLRWYLDDRRNGNFGMHTRDIVAKPPKKLVPHNFGSR